MQGNDSAGNRFHKIFRNLFSVKPVAWFLARAAHRIDRQLLSLSNGRYSAAGLLAGLPLISLTTTGAKSGRSHTVPLLGIPDGNHIILIASNWGQGHHPAWYYNILANPDVDVEIHGQKSNYVARVTAGEERQRCWQLAVQIYPGYESYKKWINGREIPVILLNKN